MRSHSRLISLWHEPMVHCLSNIHRCPTPVSTLIMVAWLHFPIHFIIELRGLIVHIKLWPFSLKSSLYNCLTYPAFSISSWLFIAIRLAFHHPEELRAICRLGKFMLFSFQEKKKCYIRWNPAHSFRKIRELLLWLEKVPVTFTCHFLFHPGPKIHCSYLFKPFFLGKTLTRI